MPKKKSIRQKSGSAQVYNRHGRKRSSLKNITRFTMAALLTLVLCVTAIYLMGGEFHPIKETPTPTPILTPTPKPIPTATTPTPSPSEKSVSDVIVVIDPGHGGRDPGTVSPYAENFYEKEITLDIGLKLREKLEQEGIQVVMTRETDKELDSYWKEDVWARPRLANEVKATFFVSIHVNSFDNARKNWQSYNGTEIYHYGKNHGEFTSKEFAQIMGDEIDSVTDTKYNGVMKADYGVLRLSEMPALLVETAYISNMEDHKRLRSDAFRGDMVEGILNGTIEILKTMGAYQENGIYKIASFQATDG